MAKKKEGAQSETGNSGTSGTPETLETPEQSVETEEKNVQPETVDVTVRSPFVDRYDRNIHYSKGDVLRFERERALDVVKRGLADFLTDNPNENGQAGEKK
jgi:hypothetical protein